MVGHVKHRGSNSKTQCPLSGVHYLGIAAAEGKYHHSSRLHGFLTISCSSSLASSEDLRVLGVSTEVLDRVVDVQHGAVLPFLYPFEIESF
jgi:hypothetical protein